MSNLVNSLSDIKHWYCNKDHKVVDKKHKYQSFVTSHTEEDDCYVDELGWDVAHVSWNLKYLTLRWSKYIHVWSDSIDDQSNGSNIKE